MKLQLLMATIALTSTLPARADDKNRVDDFEDVVVSLCGSNSADERRSTYGPIIKSDPGRAAEILTELRRSAEENEACWEAKADLVSNEILSYLNSLDSPQSHADETWWRIPGGTSCVPAVTNDGDTSPENTMRLFPGCSLIPGRISGSYVLNCENTDLGGSFAFAKGLEICERVVRDLDAAGVNP